MFSYSITNFLLDNLTPNYTIWTVKKKRNIIIVTFLCLFTMFACKEDTTLEETANKEKNALPSEAKADTNLYFKKDH